METVQQVTQGYAQYIIADTVPVDHREENHILTGLNASTLDWIEQQLKSVLPGWAVIEKVTIFKPEKRQRKSYLDQEPCQEVEVTYKSAGMSNLNYQRFTLFGFQPVEACVLLASLGVERTLKIVQ